MTKQEAVSIFEKEIVCYDVGALVCNNDGCDASCEYFVSGIDLHEAMRVAIDILKNGEKDGQIVGKTLKDVPISPILDPKYKGETDGQKGETSTTKDQAAEQLHSPGETVEGSHPGDGA